MRKFFKKNFSKHGSIYIRIDEKNEGEFIVDVFSSSFFVTKQLEQSFKEALKSYLT